MSTGTIDFDFAGIQEPVDFLTALVAFADDIERYTEFASTCERWEFRRSGIRRHIPPRQRWLIFERDGKCCRNCGDHLSIKTAQLDHIMPWSAGGSDCSCNLRILCGPCNEWRSNFRTGLDDQVIRRVHVSRDCAGCAHLDTWRDEPYPAGPELVAAYCGRCGIVSAACPDSVF